MPLTIMLSINIYIDIDIAQHLVSYTSRFVIVGIFQGTNNCGTFAWGVDTIVVFSDLPSYPAWGKPSPA